MIELTSTILVAQPITEVERGQRLLHLLLKHFPSHVPERYGDSEPLRGHFDVDNLSSVLQAWGRVSFTAERPNPSLLLHVRFCPKVTRHPRHSSISLLSLQVDRAEDVERVRAFVCETSDVFNADYAVAHILTQSELEDRMTTIKKQPAVWPQASGDYSVSYLTKRIEREGFASVLRSMRNGNHTVGLKKCIPDLSWITIFGRPYIEMFGREKLLASPAYGVQELSSGGVALKLTEGLDDTIEDWEKYKIVRDRCKTHLSCDAFCDPALPTGHTYRVPQFRFPREMPEDPRQDIPYVQ